ncbi:MULTISPECIES: PepSY domain-containing protein [Luteimonas]|uniref:PepSY domain-containing protein n=1 Tax=Luteimonas TaxID=83614 RepID=UPI0013045F57|nr:MULTISPECIES: PepSY domain-containing protein [Luteimonas]
MSFALTGAHMPLHADSDKPPRVDAAYARDGVRRGELVRLEVLLADAEQRYPGRVVEVDLDDDDDEYEIEILMADGRVAELTYDARDGRLLEIEIDD